MEGEKFSDPPLFHTYTKEVNRLQPSDRTVIGVLYACVKTIVLSSPKIAVPESNEDEIPEIPANDEFMDSTGNFVKLSDISSQDTMKALVKTVDTLSKVVSLSPYTIDFNDSVRRQRMKKLLLPATAVQASARKSYREDLTKFEITARIRLQFYRLLTENGLPLRPQMSAVEKGIKESELLTFTSLAPSDLYRSNQLQEFSDMVLQETKALPNFTGALKMGDGEDGAVTRRKYFRFCSALLFAQILSEEHVTEPMIMKRYFPMTDDLLYCLHWAPPDRRNKRDLWNRTLEPIRPSSSESSDDAKPKRKKPKAAAVDTDGNAMEESPTEVSLDTVTLTPAGKMIVTVKQHSRDSANPYLTAYLHGNTFGVRLVPLHAQHTSHEEGDEEDQESVAPAPAAAATPAVTDEQTPDVPDLTELSTTNIKLLQSGFFYHTTDDVRYTVFDGPTHDPVVKPDKFGTVCMSARFPQRLQVTVCSEGSIQIVSDPSVQKEDKISPSEAEYPLFYEKSRFIGENGTIYRHFDGKQHPIASEYLLMDGSRELHISSDKLHIYRNRSPRTAAAQSTTDDIFEFSLLKLIPLETKIIQLTATGEVNCYCLSDDTPSSYKGKSEDDDHSGQDAKHVAPASVSSSPLYQRLRVNISNIMTTTIDAETKCQVQYFRDGRLRIVYPDASTRIQFPDRTVLHFHPRNKMLYLSRFRAWPTIEMDIEVDSMCRGHAKGLEVPINKGGERVRSRVSLPDGSMMMIKYDTRVTATSNGSIRMVARDRTQLTVSDDGKLVLRPFTTWNKESQMSFDKDLMIEDVVPEVVTHTGMTIAHFAPLDGMMPTTANNKNSTNQLLHPLQESSLNGGSSTTTLPTQTSSKVKEDASRVSYQGKQTAAALKGGKGHPRRQDSMNTIKTVPSGASLPSVQDPSKKASNNKAPEDMDHHELFTSSAEADAVVTVHLRTSHIHILDYEYNAFDVDLTPGRRKFLLAFQEEQAHMAKNGGKKRSNSAKARAATAAAGEPTETTPESNESFTYKVTLAGEVEGLKPPAVARIPKSPRCFIVNRFGEATEVLSVQDVSVWECFFKNMSDSFRVEQSVELPPAELGPCRLLRYFLPKRLITSYLDGFSFEDIGSKRQYCSAVIPAAAQYYLTYQASTLHHINEEDWLVHNMPRIFETLSLLERQPLSNEGYNRITSAIQRCEEFRQQRVKNIDRFAIDDPRTQEQIEEEEMMVKRLKQLYKAAKATATKKKENRFDAMKIEEGEEGEEEEDSVVDKRKGGSITSSPSKLNSARSNASGGHGNNNNKKKPQAQSTILEAQNEDEDADNADEEDADFISEDEKEPDPVEVNIKNTFDDFLADINPTGGYASDLLPTSCLQDAFIQMFNRFVSSELIEQASYDCGEVDPGLEELTFNEFRAIYFSLDRLINGGTGRNIHSEFENNEFSRSQDSHDFQEDRDGYGGIGVDSPTSRNRSRTGTVRNSFAENNDNNDDELFDDKKNDNSNRFVNSAPLLNFNKLRQSNGTTPQSSVPGEMGSKDGVGRWDDGASLGMGSANFADSSPRNGNANNNGAFAAGSGLRMVRNVKSTNG